MKNTYYFLATIVLVIFILMTGKFFFAPLFLATFLAILISPVVNFLEIKKISSILSVILSVTLLFSVIGAVLLTIGVQYTNMIEHMPSITDKLTNYSINSKSFLASKLGLSNEFLTDRFDQLVSQGTAQLGGVAGSLFTSLSSFFSFLILVPIFTFLIVYNRQLIRTFIRDLSENYAHVSFGKWIGTVAEIQHVIKNYILGILFVTTLVATLNTIGLTILGVPYALVLGISAAVLAIIPYIGNLIGGGLAALIALASVNEWTALGVVLLFAAVQALEGNLITPKVMGDQINVSPMSVIVALLIGGYIWGIIGMILSVPTVAILNVLLSKKDELQPFATLIEGNE